MHVIPDVIDSRRLGAQPPGTPPMAGLGGIVLIRFTALGRPMLKVVEPFPRAEVLDHRKEETAS